jgi:hypothetical protein
MTRDALAGKEVLIPAPVVAAGAETPKVAAAQPAAANPVPVAARPAPVVNAPRNVPVDLKVSLAPEPGTFAAKRRAASDALWSMFVAGILSAVLPILSGAAQLFITRSVPELGHFVSLAALGGLFSWFILGVARYWETYRVELSSRRLCMLLFGLVAGAAALGTNVWLGQQLPPSMQEISFASWEPRFTRSLASLLLIYASMFGVAFAVPDWAKAACSTRSQRFSVGRVVWTGFLGYVMAFVLHGMQDQWRSVDPFWMGSLMAIVTVIVQWVSPWRERRPALRPAVPRR